MPPFDAVDWRSIDLTGDDHRPLRERVQRRGRGRPPGLGLPAVARPGFLEELGVGGTRRVLDAVAGAGVPHLVHMSSVGAYSPSATTSRSTRLADRRGARPRRTAGTRSTAERLLDSHEQRAPGRLVTRLRPGIVGQRSAGSALLRYAVPGWSRPASSGTCRCCPWTAG